MDADKWVIMDWAGNRCFPDESFDTFDDAADFLYEMFPEEESFDDYVITLESTLNK